MQQRSSYRHLSLLYYVSSEQGRYINIPGKNNIIVNDKYSIPAASTNPILYTEAIIRN
ncbi:hypothetical protein J9174_00300 [Macrococcoides canis]|uniref:hypothetical protein n=1 Tax=Macrococcoides canis TaxID=1855823 RepID=UPI001AEC01A5|nr:hypothetical protein [Macrococcus canis]QTQ08162.1 hypothetical protein J9174_00300 [Macrococcus canis]